MVIGDKKIYNKAISLYDKLSNEFNKDWNNITLCSAFLSDSAANSLIELIEDIGHRKLKLTIMIGVKNNFTSPSSIRKLLDYINTCKKSNIEFKLILPMDNDFHIKAYVFKNEFTSKAIIGSANLTDTGLKSKGELSIDIKNDDVNGIIEYIDSYLSISQSWSDCIDQYEKRYSENKSTIVASDVQSLKINKPVNRKNKNKNSRLGKVEYMSTNLVYQKRVSPTMDTLCKLSKEKLEKVDMVLKVAQIENSNIIKSNSILFFNQSPDDIEYIHDKYKVNSIFDSPNGINQNWNIGDKRSICTIGAIRNISEDEVIIFMKRGCIHYEVTEEIISIAEELGIKSIDDEEECIPSKVNMEKYIKFIKNHR